MSFSVRFKDAVELEDPTMGYGRENFKKGSKHQKEDSFGEKGNSGVNSPKIIRQRPNFLSKKQDD